jgi:predicted metal-dependent peptidase
MTSLAKTLLVTDPIVDVEYERKRVETAYNKLGIREPFVAAVMSKIKREVVVDPRIPTAATNGAWVKYNPNFTAKCSDPQLFGLVLHESLHVILMHMWRRGQRHPGLWNYANDAIINLYIRSRGYELPENGVDVKWVTEAMSSELVYKRMKDELPEPPEKPEPPAGGKPCEDGEGEGEGEEEGEEGDDKGGSGSGGGDDDDDSADDGSGSGSGSGSGGSADGSGGDEGPEDDGIPKGGWDNSGDLLDADDEASKADLEATIITAAQMAKTCGQGSALIDRILGDIGKPSVDWEDVCREMLTSSARTDFSFSRPNRRYVWQNIFMPSLLSEAVGALLIGFDVSGSMSQSEANQVAAEITAIASDLNPEFVEVVYCDTRITKVERFEQGDDVVLNVVGGGGTAFAPVFDYLAASEEQYAGMIYFTDMCARTSHLVQPDIPVIWADTSGHYGKENPPPFGVVVEVKL